MPQRAAEHGELNEQTEVLVAGAGPTGLVMAIRLAEQDVPFRIVDREPVRSDKSRALAVQARSLEIMARMGLVEPLLRKGTHVFQGNINVRGRTVASVAFSDIGIDEIPYPFVLFISQAETEAVLEARLNELGYEVERPVTLESFVQDSDGVNVLLESRGHATSVRARYLVGADGAHSTVRHGCNLSFHGERYAYDFILADVAVDWDREYGQFHFFLGRDGIFAFLPLPGERRFRLISTRSLAESHGHEPTIEEFERRICDHCRITARLGNPTWLALFRLHHRGVDYYRKGRAFVAGDAAHIHSPAGGQGMNTGIQDSWNLAWKLALVLKHEADPAILDSYHEERHPVGQKLLKFTDRLFSFMISRSWLASLVRTRVIPLLASVAMRTPERRARAFRFVSQTGIRYRSSMLNQEIGKFREGPRAGDRLPDIALKQHDGRPTRLHAQLSGRDFRLFVFCGTVERDDQLLGIQRTLQGYRGEVVVRPVVIGRGDTPSEYLLDEDGAVHRRFGIADAGFYLVRPDDHIGFRSQGIAVDALRRYLVSFCRLATRPDPSVAIK